MKPRVRGLYLEADKIHVGEEIVFIPLGKGIITFVDHQSTLTKGKYYLIFEVNFEIGQTCVFSKLFDVDNFYFY